MSEGKDFVTIRIESMVEQLSISSQSKSTIFKVDDPLREGNEKDYEPEIIAIGPIHHGKDHVRGMEWHKVKYLQQLLQRIDRLSIEKCVMEVREMEEKARHSYAKPLQLSQDEFVEMLLIDGCFVIELIRKYLFDKLRDKHDLIFQFDRILCQIRHDLILFENQLPFFVLNQLFEITRTEDPEDSISNLILFFVEGLLPWHVSKPISKSDTPNADHLLGFVHQSCFSFSTTKIIQKEAWDEHSSLYIKSSSELKEAGIQLKGLEGITLMDVTFMDGVLKLPQLNVSDKTESLFRNLITYEQCLSNDHRKYVTDYAYFMHCLVNSTKDIEILRHRGIITNVLGSDEMVYQMFKSLGKNVIISSDFSYSGVFNSLNRHCGIQRKKRMAKLWRTYFNSPWSFVSFLAAFMLLLLTLTQTVVSVISYRKK